MLPKLKRFWNRYQDIVLVLIGLFAMSTAVAFREGIWHGVFASVALIAAVGIGYLFGH